VIRHVVAFRFRADVSEADRQRVLDELATFPSVYPSMQRWGMGRNVSTRDGTFTHAFSIEFDREEDLVSYLSSETHEHFVAERFRPVVADRAIVSFEVPDEDGPRPRSADAGTGAQRRDWMPRSPVRAVIFDMDGLLIDTGPAWRRVGDEFFAAVGLDVSAVTGAGITMGLRLADAAALLREYVGVNPGDLVDLEPRVEAAMVEAVHSDGALKPGALDALDFCAENGFATALASGSTKPILDAVLERFGLSGRFQVVTSASDDPFGKPHPALFLRTADALGTEARHCAVLEDAVNGCIAAKAAGMRVVAVPDGPAVGDARFAVADLVHGSLADVRSPEVAYLLGLPAT
jgi:beta-phosphoglucomutase-like phosphatase (HAD superfamily)